MYRGYCTFQWRIQTFRSGGALVIETQRERVGSPRKNFFRPLGPQFGLKSKGWPGPPRPFP